MLAQSFLAGLQRAIGKMIFPSRDDGANGVALSGAQALPILSGA